MDVRVSLLRLGQKLGQDEVSLWDTRRHLLIARGVSVKTYNILHLQFLTMDIVEKMSVDKAPMVEKVTILEDPSSQLTQVPQ